MTGASWPDSSAPPRATGKPGLGLVRGGSGPPSGDQKGFVACSQIHFGAVDIQATAGCFLRDPKNPSSGAGVAESAISLNGLNIVPDAGARIFIDPHAHTILTQGAVRVIAQGAGSNPVTLWHGPLNVTIPDGADVGATLFDFPMNEFAANVEGFGISAQAKVILTKDGVRIPVDLEMPDYFGGITGHAELLVDARSGLHLDSLNFNIADVDIGALEIKDANLQYMSTGDKWDGGATVIVPGPGVTVGAELHFAHGAFNGGNFRIAEFPGILVFSDVWLNEIRIGFQLDPVVFSGGVTFGFQPIAPPDTYAIGVRGDFQIEAGPPVVVQISGSGSVFGIDIAHAFFRYSSDGTLRILGDVTIGDPSSARTLRGTEVRDHRQGVRRQHRREVCAFGVCDQVAVAANQRGLAVCLGFPGSISHDWADSVASIDIHLGTCVADDYGAPAGTSAVRRAGDGAPGQTFTVPAGASAYTVAVAGNGGTPRVSLARSCGANRRVRRPQEPSHSSNATFLEPRRRTRRMSGWSTRRPGPTRSSRPPARPPSPDCGSPGATPPPRSPRRSAAGAASGRCATGSAATHRGPRSCSSSADRPATSGSARPRVRRGSCALRPARARAGDERSSPRRLATVWRSPLRRSPTTPPRRSHGRAPLVIFARRARVAL